MPTRKSKLFPTLTLLSALAFAASIALIVRGTLVSDVFCFSTSAGHVGAKYRVRAGYLTTTSGDSVNYTNYSPYYYFTFTK